VVGARVHRPRAVHGDHGHVDHRRRAAAYAHVSRVLRGEIVRLGAKPLIIGGLVALAAGLVWLSFARPTGNYAVDVLPASLVAALGQALAFIPSLGTAISSARPEEGGLASGIVNTAYQVGSALGLAAMTAVAASYGATRLGRPGRAHRRFRRGLWRRRRHRGRRRAADGGHDAPCRACRGA
jgi:hypothetical protein